MATFLVRLFKMALVAGVFALALSALFNRSSSGVTFALENDFNLTIDSAASFNGVPVPGSTWELKDLVPGVDKFFDLDGLMPGDSGSATISMHVESRQSSAWLCLDFTNLESDENGVNEPESDVDENGDTSGELADKMDFFAWRDDGDNVFEAGEQVLFGPSSATFALDDFTYPIADSTTGTTVPTGSTRYVGVMWCAGGLTVNTSSGETSCDPDALGNEAQTDSLVVDVVVRAELERGRPGFTCSGEVLPDGRQRPPRSERSERAERAERSSR